MTFDDFLRKMLKFIGYPLLLLILTMFWYVYKEDFSRYISNLIRTDVSNLIRRDFFSVFISTSTSFSIVFLLGFLLGRSIMKKNVINALDFEEPSYVEDIFVIPIKDHTKESHLPFRHCFGDQVIEAAPSELTKADLDFWIRGREKGFLFCLSTWPDKYFPQFNWMVKYFHLKIAILTAVACYLGIVVKDYLDAEVFFSSVHFSFLLAAADLVIFAATFFSALIIGEQRIKRRLFGPYKKEGVPMKLGQYLAIPCRPFFHTIETSFVLPLRELRELIPTMQWKLSDNETDQEVQNHLKMIVSKELEKKGYHYEADLDLWISPSA